MSIAGKAGFYEPSNTDYELVGSRASQSNKREFSNPLYSDIGPATTTETDLYEAVSCCHGGVVDIQECHT